MVYCLGDKNGKNFLNIFKGHAKMERKDEIPMESYCSLPMQ